MRDSLKQRGEVVSFPRRTITIDRIREGQRKALLLREIAAHDGITFEQAQHVLQNWLARQ